MAIINNVASITFFNILELYGMAINKKDIIVEIIGINSIMIAIIFFFIFFLHF